MVLAIVRRTDSLPSRRPSGGGRAGGDAAGRGRSRRALTPADLAGEPLILYERGGTIRQVIEGWFKRGRVTPRVAMELGNGEDRRARARSRSATENDPCVPPPTPASAHRGLKPVKPTLIQNWCGYDQQFIPWPEADGYWLCSPSTPLSASGHRLVDGLGSPMLRHARVAAISY